MAKLDRVPNSMWSMTDVAMILLCIIVGDAVIVISCISLLENRMIAFRVSVYLIGILGTLLPVYWIKHKYSIQKEDLGIRKTSIGPIEVFSTILISIVVYSVFAMIMASSYDSLIVNMNISDYYLSLIMLPISIDGFPTIVLSPISEEILYRGVVYGYLRVKINMTLAFILQAFLFSLLHYDFIFPNGIYFGVIRFVGGLIFAASYEISGSLYIPIISHAIINYFSFIFAMNWR